MIPTSGFNLQELALAKEDARIRARRERDEERRHRFLNARTRIMGLDAAALDEQVQEMRRSREDAKESDRLEKLRMIQISNMLEQAHEEEKNMRRQQLDELKQSWESEIEAKRARAPEPYVLDLEQCGPASAQNFGNDEEKDDRKSRIQKEEMRTWVKDALIEKKHRSVAEREEDMRYAALLQALDGYREAAETEEKEMEKIVKLSIKDENAAMAMAARSQRHRDNNAPETSTSLNLFNEDLYAAYDASGRIIRRDHFKGFTPAQLRRLMQENEMILKQKRDQDASDRTGDRSWTRQQMLIERAMEEANQEEKALREQEKARHLAVLRAQAEEKARAMAQYKAEQREKPSLTGGFYDGFGKSCR